MEMITSNSNAIARGCALSAVSTGQHPTQRKRLAVPDRARGGAAPYCKLCRSSARATEGQQPDQYCATCRGVLLCRCPTCSEELPWTSRTQHAAVCQASADSRRSPVCDAVPVAPVNHSTSAINVRVNLERGNDGYCSNTSTDSQPSTAQAQSSRVIQVRAMYKYIAMRKDDLSFQENDIIEVVAKRPSGWWVGRLGETVGVFPSNYVEPLATVTASTTSAVATENGGVSSTNTCHGSPASDISRSSPGKQSPCPKSPSPPRSPLPAYYPASVMTRSKSKRLAPDAETESYSTMMSEFQIGPSGTTTLKKMKGELEAARRTCEEQSYRIRALEAEKKATLTELRYIKSVLESTVSDLRTSQPQEEALALQGLQQLSGWFLAQHKDLTALTGMVVEASTAATATPI